MHMLKYEQELKWVALVLGIASTIALVNNWHPWPLFFGLPFCMLWVYFGWLRTEPQLKYINLVFIALYIYGIVKFFWWK